MSRIHGDDSRRQAGDMLGRAPTVATMFIPRPELSEEPFEDQNPFAREETGEPSPLVVAGWMLTATCALTLATTSVLYDDRAAPPTMHADTTAVSAMVAVADDGEQERADAATTVAADRLQPAPLVTGSLAPEAQPTGSAAQMPRIVEVPPTHAAGAPAGTHPPSPPAMAIGLGVFTSLSSLKANWAALAGAAPEILGNLDPLAAIDDSAAQLRLRLVAGPFADAESAERACDRLDAEGLACHPTLYNGQPLTASR